MPSIVEIPRESVPAEGGWLAVFRPDRSGYALTARSDGGVDLWTLGNSYPGASAIVTAEPDLSELRQHPTLVTALDPWTVGVGLASAAIATGGLYFLPAAILGGTGFVSGISEENTKQRNLWAQTFNECISRAGPYRHNEQLYNRQQYYQPRAPEPVVPDAQREFRRQGHYIPPTREPFDPNEVFEPQ